MFLNFSTSDTQIILRTLPRMAEAQSHPVVLSIGIRHSCVYGNAKFYKDHTKVQRRFSCSVHK